MRSPLPLKVSGGLTVWLAKRPAPKKGDAVSGPAGFGRPWRCRRALGGTSAHTTAAVGGQIFREGTLNPSRGASTLHCAQECLGARIGLMPGWERPSDFESREMFVKRIVVLAVVIAIALVLSSAAFASSITCVHSSTCSSGNLGGGTSNSGTLPFTGVDLAGVAGLAGLLLMSGLTLYRLGRRRS